MKRVRVGIFFQGVDQWYQREAEVREGTKYVAKPFFVFDKRQAITMSEEFGLRLVERLRALKVNSAFLEDVSNERRIDLPQQNVPDSGEDNRRTMIASLNDVDEYLVKPICRPEGRKWFLRIDVPGVAEPQVIYADDVLGVLQRAEDMGFLKYAVKYERPQPQAPPVQNSDGARRRPGDMR